MHGTLREEPSAVPKPLAGEGTAVGVGPRRTDEGASPREGRQTRWLLKLNVARRRADDS